MANPPSDHATAEDQPGQFDPAEQGPLEAPAPEAFALGLQNPVNYLPIPAPGLPTADASAPMPSPRLAAAFAPPLHGPGPLTIAQSSIGLPLSLAGGQQPNQANLIPLIAFPVLSRQGGIKNPAWAIPVAIAGLSLINARATYHDLKMTPGIRGIQISYPVAAPGLVTIVQNGTKMSYSLPVTAGNYFLPLYMAREWLDLTISVAGGNFPAGSTCVLLSEEQLPAYVA